MLWYGIPLFMLGTAVGAIFCFAALQPMSRTSINWEAVGAVATTLAVISAFAVVFIQNHHATDARRRSAKTVSQYAIRRNRPSMQTAMKRFEDIFFEDLSDGEQEAEDFGFRRVLLEIPDYSTAVQFGSMAAARQVEDAKTFVKELDIEKEIKALEMFADSLPDDYPSIRECIEIVLEQAYITDEKIKELHRKLNAFEFFVKQSILYMPLFKNYHDTMNLLVMQTSGNGSMLIAMMKDLIVAMNRELDSSSK